MDLLSFLLSFFFKVTPVAPRTRIGVSRWNEVTTMAPDSHYERLSALDASFLDVEDRCAHMHIGSVAIFESGPATGPGRGIDPESVHHLVSVALEGVPRYRQRVETMPLLGHPVWVDDASFNLHYHLRHTRLALPCDERQLKRLAGRLMSQQLDRGKPLWETWFIEGLEGDRFAIVAKVHHCMVDGIGSLEVTTATLRTEPGPDPRLAGQPQPFVPRPVPAGRDLLLGELRYRAGGALGFIGTSAGALFRPREAVETVTGVVEGIATGFGAASSTPFNVEIGPHRRFDWTAMDLGVVRAVKGRLGGTVNDVVLAVVAGAMRRYLGQRGVDVDRLDFRAMVPVNLRAGSEGVGNRVASVVARLPVEEPDARQRFERVRRETEAVKHSHQIDAGRAIEDITDWSFTTLLGQMTRLAMASQPFNLVVTNVPGPQFPLYFLGARMLECYPLVPLFHNQALGIALFSYDGRLFWGFNADWDAVPDLHELVGAVDEEFRLLVSTAGLEADARQPVSGKAAVH
jgi:diacylglycerol O-acyltransferase / wax synthase